MTGWSGRSMNDASHWNAGRAVATKKKNREANRNDSVHHWLFQIIYSFGIQVRDCHSKSLCGAVREWLR